MLKSKRIHLPRRKPSLSRFSLVPWRAKGAGFTKQPPVVIVSSPQSSIQELAQQTPARVGQDGVELGDATPMPHKAARRLAQFLDEVQVQQESL